MPLASGTKLGPYEITGNLGAGGMGEVYRARDTRLDRTVAVKILPSHLSENVEAKQRFDREARAISSLNHPNICALYDVGAQDGTSFLVMEYLEGETLADRLKKGPLPIDQVLRYGIEICDGLERAHRSGVVHRDLKPGNIMLTKAGAKLMDFGLAKAAVATPSGSSSLTVTLSTPAATHPLTAQGTVVGTFQYMSPEQVEGKESDARSDIFALGAVLYEMATSKRAFEGKTAASAMAAVLERDPAPISSIQPMIPPALDRLVKICLAKDPDDRWQTVHDLKLQLKQIAEGGSQTGVPAIVVHHRKNRERLAWGIAVLFAILAIAAGLATYIAGQKQSPVLRVAINPPEKTQFNLTGDSAGPATISPDGRYLVFSANEGGPTRLFLRALDSVQFQPLPGTEGGTFPFWSPDSRSIGFFTNDKLKRISISGGQPVTICDANLGRGGSWGQDNRIIVAPYYNSGIHVVSANGGPLTPITKIDNVTYTSHRWPFLLPDQKHFLYIGVNHNQSNGPDTGVFFASIDGKENRLLVHTLANAIYSSGNLLYMRDNAPVAQPFDPSTGQFKGDPVPLQESIQFDGGLWRQNVSVSDTGIMVYASGSASGGVNLTWFDRSGKHTHVAENEALVDLAISPDDKKLAVADTNTASAEIWVYDLTTNLKTRLTFSGGVHRFPVWSPDGTQLAFDANQQSTISVKPVTGVADERPLLTVKDASISGVSDWSPDGKYIVYNQGAGTKLQVWVLPLSGDPKPFQYSPALPQSQDGHFSPDGHWLTYLSTESGRPEVYVAPFPWTGAKWQISNGGASQTRWGKDGKEIFFAGFDGMLSAAQVDISGPTFRVNSIKPLFRLAIANIGAEISPSRDGQHFITIVAGENSSQPLTLVQNWTAELKK